MPTGIIDQHLETPGFLGHPASCLADDGRLATRFLEEAHQRGAILLDFAVQGDLEGSLF